MDNNKYFESFLFFTAGIALAVISYCAGLIIDIENKK